jgi:hypothetical protein
MEKSIVCVCLGASLMLVALPGFCLASFEVETWEAFLLRLLDFSSVAAGGYRLCSLLFLFGALLVLFGLLCAPVDFVWQPSRGGRYAAESDDRREKIVLCALLGSSLMLIADVGLGFAFSEAERAKTWEAALLRVLDFSNGNALSYLFCSLLFLCGASLALLGLYCAAHEFLGWMREFRKSRAATVNRS